MVTADLPPNLLGNYHLQSSSAAAIDAGAAYKCLDGTTSCSPGSGLRWPAPTIDIDNQARPYSATQGGGSKYDIGADEWMP